MSAHLKGSTSIAPMRPIVIMRFVPQTNLRWLYAYIDGQSDEWLKSRFGPIEREHLKKDILPRMYGAVRNPTARWREIFYAIDAEGKIVGTALLMRCDATPGTWEISFDAIKHHGIGGDLIRQVEWYAKIAPWVTTLVAQTRTDNHEMMALLRRHNFELEIDHGEVEARRQMHDPADARNPMLIAIALAADGVDSWMAMCSPHIMLTLMKKYGSDLVLGLREKHSAAA